MSQTDIEQQCTVLRLDLKTWEKKFAAEHSGRKAGRDDIKAHAEISQKYKDYNRLRIRLSSQAAPQTPSKRTARRKSTHDAERTPKAVPKALTSTPVKKRRDEENSPENAGPQPDFPSPEGPSMIGPTPQRDGIVLGLFDMLPRDTPSKKRTVLGDVHLNVPQTPSKKLQEANSETSLESRARGERTPLSAGKRYLLNQFVTPKKRKLEGQSTPSSTQRGLTTPAFLRRDNALTAIDEADETTPRPAPWKRRGLVRSLSSMLHAIRKEEDDRLDEEADIMRELEMDGDGMPPPKKSKVSEILVEDSQAPMPLGPDRGVESEDESDDKPELGPDGKPRRVWKKKGLKRQTRRVIMRPNVAKPKLQSTQPTHDDSADEHTKVPETQVQTTTATSDHASNDDESDYSSDASNVPKTRKMQPKKVDEGKDKSSKDGVVKTAAKKIKATANANYRRLKIKGKGGTGGKGKFGRKR